MPQETPESRLDLLDSNAAIVVNEKYFTKLSEEELINARAAFTQNRLKMDDMEEAKKEYMADWKESMKPLQEIHRELSAEVRKGFREKEGRLYGFLEGNIMYFYDSKGELIETMTRPATTSELSQKTIFMEMPRTGTND